MTHIKLLFLFLVCTLPMWCNAQNRVEKLGLAFSGYYGASVMLKVFSEGTCKRYLNINTNEFNLVMLKASINKTLLPIITKSEYIDLQEMYGSIERDISINGIDLAKVPENKCRDLSNELIKIHQYKKSIWNNLTK